MAPRGQRLANGGAAVELVPDLAVLVHHARLHMRSVCVCVCCCCACVCAVLLCVRVCEPLLCVCACMCVHGCVSTSTPTKGAYLHGSEGACTAQPPCCGTQWEPGRLSALGALGKQARKGKARHT